MTEIYGWGLLGLIYGSGIASFAITLTTRLPMLARIAVLVAATVFIPVVTMQSAPSLNQAPFRECALVGSLLVCLYFARRELIPYMLRGSRKT
jgi:hypothetical protein